MFTFKLLDNSSLLEMYTLQNYILRTLKDKKSFRGSGKNMLKHYLNNGFAIGAYAGEKLIAYRLVYFPKNSLDNLGYDLAFNKKKLRDVYHFETALVHPKYRGMKLQILLTKELQKYFDFQKKILCATCYPFNYPSLSNLFELGLCIHIIKNKYDLNLRFIMSNVDYKLSDKKTFTCKCTNITKIKQLLKRGYIGTEIVDRKDIDDFSICFKKGIVL